MIVLHVAESDGALLLWGETAPDDSRPTPPQEVPGGGPRSHPFGAGADDITDAMERVAPLDHQQPASIESMTAWLPTRGSWPIPSSGLLGDPRLPDAPPRIEPWVVQAYRPEPTEAMVLLLTARGQPGALVPGVVAGSDLRYWARALELGSTLVSTGQFLPGVHGGPEGMRAIWNPVLTGANAERFAALAKQMPAAARALTAASMRTAPDIPPDAALRRVLTSITDHLVRNATDEEPAGAVGHPPESAHDAWLNALRSPDSALTWGADDLQQLDKQVRTWKAPIAVWELSPYRLSVRLEEPPPAPSAAATDEHEGEASQEWFLRYLLQPHDDPSLHIPVDEAWSGRHRAVLEQAGADVAEFLLTALGEAAGICPAILASLEQPHPAGCQLDAVAAHRFLTTEAPALEQAGFGVMLPSWWTGRGTRVRLSARAQVRSPKMDAAGEGIMDAIARFDWELALGDRTLTFRELEELARLKSPLVQMRGEWVEVRADEIQAALDFWVSHGAGSATIREIVQMELGPRDLPAHVDFGGIDASGWLGDLLKQLDGKANFDQIPPPDGLSGTLRPYQLRGYSWLAFLRTWGLGACLADDMGLGKTIQALALFQRDREGGAERPVLLICPTSVMQNWHREAARFTPDLPVLVHHGPGRNRGRAFARAAARHGLVVSSYALLSRDVDFLEQVPWAAVVLDEAQNIKNPESQQARAARRMGADYRIALTGTPVENHVGDLWSIMDFLNPGLLGTMSKFRYRFLLPIQTRSDPDAAETLQRITTPFILRRLKTDRSVITDLPEKIEANVFCSLTREQASLYAAVLDETQKALKVAKGMERRGIVMATLSRLKQICNHPAHFLRDNSRLDRRSGKLQRLTEMLEEVLDAGERALVFTQFAEMGGLIQHHLRETFGREILFLHGRVPRKQRDQMIERFQAEGAGPPVFVLSLRAGGTGLNLTAANHVFHFDRWWNPAVENQATDRAFRIGQTRTVQVHRFICGGTLEERIDEMIRQKMEVADLVVSAGEGWLTELSNEELRAVLALGQDAVGD